MVFDLDGTLAESKQRASAQMGELLAQLLEIMPVAVMSGAAYPQFEKQLLPAVPIEARLTNLYLFPDNAAQCYTFSAGKWHIKYDQSFTAEERLKIVKALDEALEETGLNVLPQRIWGERVEDRGAQITFSGLGKRAPIDEKARWDPDGKKRESLRVALQKRLPDFYEAAGGMSSVDITRKGITKSYGITQLVNLTGISVSEMLYLGDALEERGNDYVVIETGVRAHQVFGSDETKKVIEQVLAQHQQTDDPLKM
jgi:phosphomannomutase